MSESKHTPGPWEFGELSEEIFANNHGYVTIARIGGDDGMEDEHPELHAIHLSNARLIAAAPDLLEAARAIIAADGVIRVPEHCDSCRASLALRAAIARAEGRG